MAKVNWEETEEIDLSEMPEEVLEDGGAFAGEQSAADTAFGFSGGATISFLGQRSSNYKGNETGWALSQNGLVEFNGNTLTSTNFTQVIRCKGVSIYVSDGTTPNGNLSGTAGDLCLNGPSGQPFKCTSTTTWVGL